MNKSLVGLVGKALLDEARKQFRSSQTGQLLTELERLSKRRSVSAYQLRGIQRKLKGMGRGNLFAELRKTNLAGAVSESYAKGESTSIIRQLASVYGPIGELISTFLRPKGVANASLARELAAAESLLKSFGYDIRKPDFRPAAQRRAESRDEAQRLLEGMGFTVTPPPQATRPRNQPPVPPPEAPQPPPRNDVLEVMIGGRRRVYRLDDPLLTGEMIPVQSSNVHSIGFIFNHDDPMKGTIKVRFLQGSLVGGVPSSRGPKKGGPLYYYYGVHPDVFVAFERSASKGTFVWDRFRIRGTVSGHRYAYELKGITGGYVPRQARRFGRKEYFLQRSVRDRRGNRYRSALNDQLVNVLPERGEPGRGLPYRGR